MENLRAALASTTLLTKQTVEGHLSRWSYDRDLVSTLSQRQGLKLRANYTGA